MNYQCWPEWNEGNWAATRITTTPSSTSTSAASTSSSDASSSQTSALPAETSGANQGENKEKSKAWIAGPVIGSVIGALFFTHFGIWLYRRRLRVSQPVLGAIEKDTIPLGLAAGSPRAPPGDTVRYAHMYNGDVGAAGGLKDEEQELPGSEPHLPNQELHELGPSQSEGRVVEADGKPINRK